MAKADAKTKPTTVTVADFLESIDPAICARFIEYLINEKGDESALFHNRLAELYLRMTLSAKKRGDAGMWRQSIFQLRLSSLCGV